MAYLSSVRSPYWPQELSAGALGPWSCCRLGIRRVLPSLPLRRHIHALDLCSVPALGMPFCWGKGRDTALGQMSGYSLVGPTSTARISEPGGPSTASTSPGTWLQLLAAAHATSSPHSPSAPGSFCSLFHHLLWPQLSSCTGSSPSTTAGDGSIAQWSAGLLLSTRTSSPQSIPIPQGWIPIGHHMVCGAGGICRAHSSQPPPPSPPWASGDVWEQSRAKSSSSAPLGKTGDPSTRRP